MNENRIKVGYCNEITFLKTVFAIIVVLYHFYWEIFKRDADYWFQHGMLGVEFFFMVSGYLMMKKLNTKESTPWQYTLNHAKKLYPDYIFALMMVVLCRAAILIYTKCLSVRSLFRLCTSALQEGLILHMLQINGNYRILGQAWYISAMLMAGFVLYFLYKKFNKKLVTVIATMISAIMLFVIKKHFGFVFVNVQAISVRGYGIYMGLARGFINMSFGCLIYYLSDALNNNEKIKICAWVGVLLKIINIISTSVMLFLCCWKGLKNVDILFEILCFITVLLTFSGYSGYENCAVK